MPYKELYIYLLKGVVREEEETSLGESFVGNWVEDDSSFLFFKRPAEEMIGRLLKTRSSLEFVDDYRFTYEEWQGGIVVPIMVDDFVILPPWVEEDTHKGAILIRLDPGVVFGNGLHPTTKDCLKAILFTWRQRNFNKVLDLGTGTGILALASALLGAEMVIAADLNPLCVRTAVRNVRLNDLQRIIQVVEGSAEGFIKEPSDLMIANIDHSVIRSLLGRRAFREQERVILSGLMRTQYREVKAHLEGGHFQIIREWDHEMTWFTILAEKM